MPITKSIIESYENYGRCVKISNGTIEAYVTVDVGPRIIRFAYCGGENVLFNDLDRRSVNGGEAYDRYFYEGAKWYLYGGHRLWITPESAPETYYPDNDEVAFEYTENGAVFTPREQLGNKIQMQTELEMSEDSNDMRIIHRVTNTGDKNRQFALWGVTVMNQGGLEIIPQHTGDTGLLPNRKMTLWPYTNVTDERFYFGRKYMTVRQNPQAKPGAFKMGSDNTSGTAAYLHGDDLFVCRYDYIKDGEYPDGGVSFETYTNSLVLELETLSVIHDKAPGETAEYEIRWSLEKYSKPTDGRDENALDALMNSVK